MKKWSTIFCERDKLEGFSTIFAQSPTVTVIDFLSFRSISIEFLFTGRDEVDRNVV